MKRLFLIVILLPVSALADSLLFSNVRLIDVEAASVSEPMQLAIRDGFIVEVDSVHHELEIYVASGLTPAEALATGTTNIARYLGQSAHGCLEPGCVADLVLLTDNPLQDIRHSRTIQGVMRAGQWFDREHLDSELKAIAERAGND